MNIDADYVYVGLWTDWTKGRVLGSVITVPSSTGIIVVALLAVIVQVAGVHLWHLVRYLLHQLRATDHGVHPLGRQVQTVLRNDDAAASTGLRLFDLLWRWRGRSPPLGPTLALGLTGIFFAVCIALAGTFASYTLDTTDVSVLITSSSCGQFDFSGLQNITAETLDRMRAGVAYDQEGTSLASTYARQCYNGTSSPASCSGFAVPTINWTADYLVPCPFDEEMCIGPAMAQDTGRLNSNTVFGINFPSDQQIEMRRLLTCAPVRQDGFTRTLPYVLTSAANASATDLVPQNITGNISYYSYGPAEFEESNYTIALDTYPAAEIAGYHFVSRTDFGEAGRDFAAIPSLKRHEGGLALIFVQASGVVFDTPVDDPVFAAHQPFVQSNITKYRADQTAGIIGCLQQFQICKPGEAAACTALGMWPEAAPLAPLQLNDVQKATLKAISEAQAALLDPSRDSSDSFIAQRRLFGGSEQLSLPANQWQVEVQNYQARAMAALQVRLRLQATGPANPSTRPYILPPTGDAEKQLCRAQRVRVGQGFNNISLLGLLLVVVLSVLIIAASLLLDPLVGKLEKKASGTAARLLRSWNHDSVLQIQRIAYEDQTECKWDKVDGEVPVTSGGQLLGPLRQRNEEVLDENLSSSKESKDHKVEGA